MSKLKRCSLFLFAFLPALLLTSCYDRNDIALEEGTYAYSGEPIAFYDEKLISVFRITLVSITAEEYELTSSNVTPDYSEKPYNYFSINLNFGYEGEEPTDYDLVFWSQNSNEPNSYVFKVAMANPPGLSNLMLITLIAERESDISSGALKTVEYFTVRFRNNTSVPVGSFEGAIFDIYPTN